MPASELPALKCMHVDPRFDFKAGNLFSVLYLLKVTTVIEGCSFALDYIKIDLICCTNPHVFQIRLRSEERVGSGPARKHCRDL